MKIRIVKWTNSDLETSVLNKMNITNGAVVNAHPAVIFEDILNAEPDIAVMFSHERCDEWDGTFYISYLNGFHAGSRQKQPD